VDVHPLRAKRRGERSLLRTEATPRPAAASWKVVEDRRIVRQNVRPLAFVF
jgi:hypothetical protein